MLRIASLILTAAVTCSASAANSRALQVELATEQTSYLLGEPIFVRVVITNTATEPVVVDECHTDVGLQVSLAPRKHATQLPRDDFMKSCSAADLHWIGVNKTLTLKRQVKGYVLTAGTFELKSSIKIGAARKTVFDRLERRSSDGYVSLSYSADPLMPSPLEPTVNVVVEEGRPAELRARLQRFIEDAANSDPAVRRSARAVLAELALPELRTTYVSFAKDGDVDYAVKGLAGIDDDHARDDLINLFRTSTDESDRFMLMNSLAMVTTSREWSFLKEVVTATSNDELIEMALTAMLRIDRKKTVDSIAESCRRDHEIGLTCWPVHSARLET